MTKNALTVNQAIEQLTVAGDDGARGTILNSCTVVQIRRIVGELELNVPSKLRKPELIQAVIQTMHTPEAEAPAPMNNTPAINSSSADNPLHDVGTPAPIRATSPLQGDVNGTQLHAAHVHDEQEDVKQIHTLAIREKTSRRTNAMEGGKDVTKCDTPGGKDERDGEPWFVAKDVCEILDIQNPRDAIAKMLDEDERGVSEISTPSNGGHSTVNIISESGLYTPNTGKSYHAAFPTFKITAILGVFCRWVRVVNPLEDFEAVLGRLSRSRTSSPERHAERLSIRGMYHLPDNSQSEFVGQVPACPVDPTNFCAFSECSRTSPGTRRNTMMNFKNGP